jgi:nucleotide-binding universal stress UspA family protein
MMKIQASTTLRIEPMRTIQNILFPVDFSPSCAAMAAFVTRAAAIFGAGVTLVHIFDLYSHDAFQLYVRPPSEVAEEQEILARHKLDSFLKSEFPVGECPRILLSGDAATQIAQLARSNGFDLIIMPTLAGVFRRTLLGSTTAKVLNDTDCPVLTTQHAETIPAIPYLLSPRRSATNPKVPSAKPSKGSWAVRHGNIAAAGIRLLLPIALCEVFRCASTPQRFCSESPETMQPDFLPRCVQCAEHVALLNWPPSFRAE